MFGYDINSPRMGMQRFGQNLQGLGQSIMQARQMRQQQDFENQVRQIFGQNTQRVPQFDDKRAPIMDPMTGRQKEEIKQNRPAIIAALQQLGPQGLQIAQQQQQSWLAEDAMKEKMKPKSEDTILKQKKEYELGTSKLIQTLSSATPEHHWDEFLKHEYKDSPEKIKAVGPYDEKKVMEMVKRRKFTQNLFEKALKEKDPEKALKEEKERISKQANELRDEFNTQSKDFIKVRDAFSRVQASAAKASAAGDLSMIFNYMKILDPGSVVRESEFATAAAAGAFGDRIQAAVGRVLKGTKLDDTMRLDFLSRANDLYRVQLKNQNQLESSYSYLANQLEVDPSLVIVPYRAAEEKNKNVKTFETKPPNMTAKEWKELQELEKKYGAQ